MVAIKIEAIYLKAEVLSHTLADVDWFWSNPSPDCTVGLDLIHTPAVVANPKAPFTQDTEVLAKNGTHCCQWECSHSIASNIKGFVCKFACKPAYTSCVNWAQLDKNAPWHKS